MDSGKIGKDTVFEILKEIAEGKEIGFGRYEKLSDKELEEKIKSIMGKNKGMPLNALIGKVMGEVRGKAEGKRIVELVKKHFQQKL